MFQIPSSDAEKIIRIAKGAGEILLKHFKTGVDVEFKKNEFDPVTIADKEADAFIRSNLEQTFPEDFLLSEEHEALPKHYNGRVWMVDPLDGTKYFIKGSDNFSVMIGLVENGIPILGCVVIPAQNKIFYAEKNKGCFRKVRDEDFKKITANKTKEIKDARLITRHFGKDIREWEEKTNNIGFAEKIPAGSLGIKLAMIAEGTAEAHINTANFACKWDSAAGEVILTEAGGMVTDFDGNLIDYKNEDVCLNRSIVASANEHLHRNIISELKKLEV